MIVVDASLATKWFLTEADSDAALRFLVAWQYQLVAPDLLSTEVAGAIVRHANMNTGNSARVLALLTEWRRLQDGGRVRTERVDPRRMEEAAALALDLGHPLADCTYLQLAIELGFDLATADVKFRDRAIALFPRIRLLAEYA